VVQKNEISADRLRQLILLRHPDNFMAFADLFALGCLLHAQGQKIAGRKLIEQVAGAVKERGNQTYLSDLRDGLEGNEFIFASQVHAHHEVNELLDAERKRQAIERI
jgi:hypothetical protein